MKIKRIINEFRLIKALLLVGLFLLITGMVWGQLSSPTATPGTVCAGATVQLDAVASGGSGSYTYTWTSIPIGFTSTIYNPVANPTVTTIYNIEVSDGSSTVNSQVTVTVNALPSVTFLAQPGANTCIGSNVIYTTEDIMTNYVWGFPGTLGTDYNIISGGTITSNTVTIGYLTTGTRTVTINYTNSLGCTATLATSSTATTINPLPATSLIYHQ